MANLELFDDNKDFQSTEKELRLLQASIEECDAPLPPLVNGGPDVDLWRKILNEIPETERTWKESPSFISEFYFYRKIADIFSFFDTNRDPYDMEKMGGLLASYPLIESVCSVWSELSSNTDSRQLLYLAFHSSLWAYSQESILWQLQSNYGASTNPSSTLLPLDPQSPLPIKAQRVLSDGFIRISGPIKPVSETEFESLAAYIGLHNMPPKSSSHISSPVNLSHVPISLLSITPQQSQSIHPSRLEINAQMTSPSPTHSRTKPTLRIDTTDLEMGEWPSSIEANVGSAGANSTTEAVSKLSSTQHSVLSKVEVYMRKSRDFVLSDDSRATIEYLLDRRQADKKAEMVAAMNTPGKPMTAPMETMRRMRMHAGQITTPSTPSLNKVKSASKPTSAVPERRFSFSSSWRQQPSDRSLGGDASSRQGRNQKRPSRRFSFGQGSRPLRNIGIVTDSAGYELVCDLLLGHALILSDVTDTVTFHTKAYPSFVYNATSDDIRRVIFQLNESDGNTYAVAVLLKDHLESGRFIVQEHFFWNLPTGFCALPPDLCRDMEYNNNILTILKGDANYARLLDDRKWPVNMSLAGAIDQHISAIYPATTHMASHTSILALRVIKSEVVCGISDSKIDKARGSSNPQLSAPPTSLTGNNTSVGNDCQVAHTAIDDGTIFESEWENKEERQDGSIDGMGRRVESVDSAWQLSGKWAVVQLLKQVKDNAEDNRIHINRPVQIEKLDNVTLLKMIKQSTVAELQHARWEVEATLMGERGYHIMWTLYVCSLTIIGGCCIVSTGGYAWIDAWFLATSAAVNGGLSVLPMDALPHSAFVILQFLMILGSSCFMLLPLLVYRCYCLRQYSTLMAACAKCDFLSATDHRVVKEYQTLHRASWITAVVVLLYIGTCIGLGFVVMMAALHQFPMEPSLVDRNYTRAHNALFLSISAFTNSGLTISADGLSHLSNNALALGTMGVLILAGNTLMPVFLRRVLELMHWFLRNGIKFRRDNFIHSSQWADAIAYALAHPRKISTHLFSAANTQYLLQISLIINGFEYILFLARTLNSKRLAYMGSKSVIAGLGLFQILNTRHAGFSVFNLRELPQETLFVNVLLMFMQAVPYMGLLHTTRKF